MFFLGNLTLPYFPGERRMGIRHVYHINIQCNKVKVIVIIFSCCSDFALKTISWINVILGILVLGDTTIDSITNIGTLIYISWSSNFAAYLEC